MAELARPALPPALAADPRFAALCDLLWEQHASLPLEQLLLYIIDLAPEVALMPLAEQFSLLDETHWPDASTSATKRRLIHESIAWHRRKGTPWAVKAALSVLGGETQINEWFAQTPPGAPYTFNVEHIPAPGSALDDQWFARIRRIVHSAKSARSHLDKVRLVLDAPPATVYTGACTVISQTITLYPPQPGTLNTAVSLHGGIAHMTHHLIDLYVEAA